MREVEFINPSLEMRKLRTEDFPFAPLGTGGARIQAPESLTTFVFCLSLKGSGHKSLQLSKLTFPVVGDSWGREGYDSRNPLEGSIF